MFFLVFSQVQIKHPDMTSIHGFDRWCWGGLFPKCISHKVTAMTGKVWYFLNMFFYSLKHNIQLTPKYVSFYLSIYIYTSWKNHFRQYFNDCIFNNGVLFVICKYRMLSDCILASKAELAMSKFFIRHSEKFSNCPCSCHKKHVHHVAAVANYNVNLTGSKCSRGIKTYDLYTFSVNQLIKAEDLCHEEGSC